MQSRPVTIETETGIRHEFQLATFEAQPRPWNLLIAKFSGEYRPGHRGAPDARLIQGITQAALTIWFPKALVLDFRELTYVWGDEMEEVLVLRGEFKLPFAVVGSTACLPAMGTLIQQFHPRGTIKAATDAENIFDNMEDALEYVRQKRQIESAKDAKYLAQLFADSHAKKKRAWSRFSSQSRLAVIFIGTVLAEIGFLYSHYVWAWIGCLSIVIAIVIAISLRRCAGCGNPTINFGKTDVRFCPKCGRKYEDAA